MKPEERKNQMKEGPKVAVIPPYVPENPLSELESDGDLMLLVDEEMEAPRSPSIITLSSVDEDGMSIVGDIDELLADEVAANLELSYSTVSSPLLSTSRRSRGRSRSPLPDTSRSSSSRSYSPRRRDSNLISPPPSLAQGSRSPNPQDEGGSMSGSDMEIVDREEGGWEFVSGEAVSGSEDVEGEDDGNERGATTARMRRTKGGTCGPTNRCGHT